MPAICCQGSGGIKVQTFDDGDKNFGGRGIHVDRSRVRQGRDERLQSGAYSLVKTGNPCQLVHVDQWPICRQVGGVAACVLCVFRTVGHGFAVRVYPVCECCRESGGETEMASNLLKDANLVRIRLPLHDEIVQIELSLFVFEMPFKRSV